MSRRSWLSQSIRTNQGEVNTEREDLVQVANEWDEKLECLESEAYDYDRVDSGDNWDKIIHTNNTFNTVR